MSISVNPAVEELIAAINAGDRQGFLDQLSPDAVLTDDGRQQPLQEWIDREIFTTHGHLTVESRDETGLDLIARYSNDMWGEMRTSWHFEVTGGKISRIDTGQA